MGSIASVWSWLVHVPLLGFVVAVVAGLALLFFLYTLWIWAKDQ